MEEENKDKRGEIDVGYVARLARLYLSDAETATFQRQLGDVVEYVRKIGKLDLAGIEPTSHTRPVHNVYRDDVLRPGLSHEVVMENAPLERSGQFGVPSIIE